MEKKKSDDVNSKWDACLDLTARRVVYSSLGGAFAGLLFFNLSMIHHHHHHHDKINSLVFGIGSPVTRWASIAFGAGLGIGSAYTDCSRVFDASSSSSASAALVAPISTETSSSSSYVSQVNRKFLFAFALFVGISVT
ncbi:hypothetical protein YC2023_096696 [Brassica napus]